MEFTVPRFTANFLPTIKKLAFLSEIFISHEIFQYKCRIELELMVLDAHSSQKS